MDESGLRSLTPTVIGILVRRGADFPAAEDAVQDALVEAVRAWPADPPRDPKGWLVTVAWRKFLDTTRADAARHGCYRATTWRNGRPSRSAARFSAIRAEAPIGRPPAACGVMMTSGSSHSPDSAGSGSVSKTSRAAPPSRPARIASSS